MYETNTELLKQLFSAIERGVWGRAGIYLTDEFKFSGPTPEPVDKKGFLELHQALVSAIPDWSFNAHDFKESGENVSLKVRISGTHLKELNLPLMGIRSVQATNKKFSLPEEKVDVTFKNGKITSFKVEIVANAGLPGILSQLGIKVPAVV